MGAIKKFPVVEIFGPTIQGEGVDQGVPCHFVRFGGCDYRCEWCDTPHAVLPHAVRTSQRLSEDEVVLRLGKLTPGPRWVILSGGNPALHDLDHLVELLHSAGYSIAVETQGSRFKEWLFKVDRLCVSPKPPSSGMKVDWHQLTRICESAHLAYGFLKVVVFDQQDYEWAKSVHRRFPRLPFYVSAGNDAGATVGNPSRQDTRTDAQVVQDLLDRSRWLVNRVMVDPEMADVKVQSQYHVLMWGNKQGV